MLINLDPNSLIKKKGQVLSIAVKAEKGAKSTSYPLKIRVMESSKEFRLSDAYKTYFKVLEEKIKPGDTITIYTKNIWQAIFSWGQKIDIYQIDKDGETILDLAKVISELKEQTTFMGFITIILWGWHIVYRHREKIIMRLKAIFNLSQII